METKKILDKNGLEYYTGKIKQQIPKKTSDLTNDSFTLQTVIPNDAGEIKTKYRVSQKGYAGSNPSTWYYPICELPENNSSNYASVIVSGRIGGWVNTNMSYVSALVLNREGETISLLDITAGATTMSDVWGVCDIVIYRNTANTKAIVYLKCKSYFAFDLDFEFYQSNINVLYDGTYLVTEPSGTLKAQASTSTKRLELYNGKAYINGGELITTTGNAGSATKLATAKTIGIGTGATGTATSFDGSSNITIPITDVKDSYISWGGKNLSGNITPNDMGCIDEFGHNKLAFLPAECIKAEYTTDGGATWIDYGLTDAQKIAEVTTSGVGLAIGKGTVNAQNGTLTNKNCSNYKSRFTISTRAGKGQTYGKLYTSAKKWLINVSTNGANGVKILVEERTIANYNNNVDTWTTVGTYDVTGWSGWNSIPYQKSFGGGSNQTSQIADIRFTMYITSVNTNYSCTANMTDFRLIGATNWSMPSELARAGHLYTMDTAKNATFPNNVYFNDSFSLNLYPNSSSSTYRHIGSSNNQWKDLHLSDGIYHNGNKLTLPSTAGTLALTSDIANSHCVEQSSTAPTDTDIVLWIEDSDIDGSGGGGGSSIEVIDSLISTSTTDALSANQGRVLNGKITTIESNYLTSTNIKDNLTTNSATDALSAKQGKALNTRISALESDNLDSRLDTLEGQNLDTRLDTIEAKNLVESTNISKIVMVTEYPSTPDPDTLYVKVASL